MDNAPYRPNITEPVKDQQGQVPASPSRLYVLIFALPAELREQIWSEVLAEQPIFEIRPRLISQFSYLYCRHRRLGDNPAGATGPWKPAIYPPLTRTSRQIRAESLPLFYKQTIFDAPHHVMIQFFGHIGRENVELITQVRHSHHVGVGSSLSLAGCTMWPLADGYEQMGLRRTALEFPVNLPSLGRGKGLHWTNLWEARQERDPSVPYQGRLEFPPERKRTLSMRKFERTTG